MYPLSGFSFAFVFVLLLLLKMIYLICFYSWLLLMFINLKEKTEKKPNTQISSFAVFCHVFVFEREVNFMVVLSNIKHNLV